MWEDFEPRCGDFNINGENSVENDTDMKNEVGVFLSWNIRTMKPTVSNWHLVD